MWTWFVQIAAVFVGKRVGSKKILLWVWPFLFFCLAGLCAAGGAFARSNSEDTKAGVATYVIFIYPFQHFLTATLYCWCSILIDLAICFFQRCHGLALPRILQLYEPRPLRLCVPIL